MNRMTDERLAILSTGDVCGHNDTDDCDVLCNDAAELLQALKAEREKVKELEADRDQLISDAAIISGKFNKRIAELEAENERLDAVILKGVKGSDWRCSAEFLAPQREVADLQEKLAREWQPIETAPRPNYWADELQAELKKK